MQRLNALGGYREIGAIVNLQMLCQTGRDTDLIIDIAFSDANEVLIQGLPSFSDGFMVVFSSERIHTPLVSSIPLQGGFS